MPAPEPFLVPRDTGKGLGMSLGGSNRMLSAKETADMLGVSRQTLYNQWKAWGLKAHRIGGSLKFQQRDIEAWANRQAAA